MKHVDYPGTVCLHFYFCFGTSHIIVICHINIHIDVSVYGNNSQISPPDAMCFVLYCTEYFPYSAVRLPSRKIKVGNNVVVKYHRGLTKRGVWRLAMQSH